MDRLNRKGLVLVQVCVLNQSGATPGTEPTEPTV